VDTDCGIIFTNLDRVSRSPLNSQLVFAIFQNADKFKVVTPSEGVVSLADKPLHLGPVALERMAHKTMI
jgi:hypothetical protein